MNEFLTDIITDPLFGAAAALAGFLAGNRFALHRDRVRETKKAITDFSLSFADILPRLRMPIEGVVFQYNDISEIHEKAKSRLEVCLDQRCTKRLNKIWHEYKNNTKEYYAKVSGHDPDSSMSWRQKFATEISIMLKKIGKIR